MPLTEQQLEAIQEFLQGRDEEGNPDNLNTRINAICAARDDTISLVRIHEQIESEANCTAILAAARNRARAAAQAIVDLLS